MIRYYRGHIRSHAEFWVRFRELPHEERFDAFIDFFKQVKREVEEGKCDLRDAGYALKPGFYDEDIYKPREVELSFADDAVEDLIVVAPTDPDEAIKLWKYVVDVMSLYS